MGCGNLSLQTPFWMTYPEIAPVHSSGTKSCQVSAGRAGCVLLQKGEWQLSNIWQLGSRRMVAIGQIRRTLEKKRVNDRTGRGKDYRRVWPGGTDNHASLIFMD